MRHVWLLGMGTRQADHTQAVLLEAGWHASVVVGIDELADGVCAGDCVIVDLGAAPVSGTARDELQRLRDAGARLVVLLAPELAAGVVGALAGAAATLLVHPVESSHLIEVVAASLLRAEDEVRPRTPRGAASLTARESAILGRLLDGASSKQIAHELALSPKTVSTHKGHILGKYGVDSVVALIAQSLREESG
jgi:DNA-binding NarL/FixJ family response regulator